MVDVTQKEEQDNWRHFMVKASQHLREQGVKGPFMSRGLWLWVVGLDAYPPKANNDNYNPYIPL